jgi:hypothetical protein
MRIVSGEQMEIAWIEVHASAEPGAPAGEPSQRA